MGNSTENLNLYLTDMETDGNDYFDFNRDLNENWEKIDKSFSKTLAKSQITNCILEQPQNIKLEFNNGVLTLKAGSKILVPNGFEEDGLTLKFNEITIENDIIRSNYSGSAVQAMIFLNPSSGLFIRAVANIESGSSSSLSTQQRCWYDTTNNIIKWSDNSGSSWISGYSLPIALITCSTTAITSLNQVFQNISYMGSTLFIGKNLKCLYCNGRNDDGTLNNVQYIKTTLDILTVPNTLTAYNLCLLTDSKGTVGYNYITHNNSITLPLYGYNYNEKNNIIYGTNDDAIIPRTILGFFDVTKGVISNFTVNSSINLLKYSDKAEISRWAFPSNTYINMNLLASGATYGAPANGWFVISKAFSAANQFIYMATKNDKFPIRIDSSASSQTGEIFLPVLKNDTMTLSYTAGGNLNYFRFYYANGEVS